MKFEKIEWKNIFAYGNKEEQITFDDGGALWHFCGPSGAGKSSVIQLPYLIIYGETINGVKLSSIPNRVNPKDAVVRGYVTSGSDKYVITRTFNPHTITIEKNGVVVDLPGIDSNQEYIIKEIMKGVPKNIYKNVLTLSLNKDISFIDMGAKDKRCIVDFLLDMEVLNYYAELLKKDNGAVTQSINESNGSLNVLDRNLQRAKTDLDSKKSVLDSHKKVEVNETDIRNKIDEINKGFKEGRVKYLNELNKSISDLQTQKADFSVKIGAKSSQLKGYENQLNLLMSDRCPTCGSSFKTPEFDSVRGSLNSVIESSVNELTEYKNSVSIIDERIKSYQEQIQKINSEISFIDKKIQELNNMYVESERYVNAQSTYDNAFNEVSRLESERKEEMKKVSENERSIRLLGILKTVYGDNGVKKILREKYVPELNLEINNSLKSLNIPYVLEFDTNFEAVIYDRGEKVQVETLSEGEKQRANMAVLYSLIKIVKNKYPSINVIALDETTSHVGSEDALTAFRFFKSMAESMNLNVLVVSHNEMIEEDVFDHRLFVEKNGRFSQIVEK